MLPSLTARACASDVARRPPPWPPARTGRSGADPAARASRTRQQLPTEWEPGKNIAWKTELPAGSLVAGRLGRPHLPDRGRRRGRRPRREGRRAPRRRQAWIHPDSVAADRKHTLKVLALDAKTGKIVWEQTAYEGTVYDARHRRSSFAGPTAATDGTHGLRLLRSGGALRLRPRGHAGVEVDRRSSTTLGLGTGTSPVLFRHLVIIQRDEDEGEEVVDRGVRQATPARKRGRRQTSGADQLGDAGARHGQRANRARDQWHRVDHRLRSGHRQGAVADQRGRKQRHPHAARRQGTGHRDGRISGEEGHRDPAGRRCRTTSASRGSTPRARVTCSPISSTATTSIC